MNGLYVLYVFFLITDKVGGFTKDHKMIADNEVLWGTVIYLATIGFMERCPIVRLTKTDGHIYNKSMVAE